MFYETDKRTLAPLPAQSLSQSQESSSCFDRTPLAPTSQHSLHVVRFSLAFRADRYGFLPFPFPDGRGGRNPALNKEEEERPEKRKPQPPPGSSRSPSPHGSFRACAQGRPPRLPPPPQRAPAEEKPEAADPWRPQGGVEKASGKVLGPLPARRQGLPGHPPSPPEGDSRIQEPTTLPPTRSQPPPDRGSIQPPGAACGARLGTRGRARAETHR